MQIMVDEKIGGWHVDSWGRPVNDMCAGNLPTSTERDVPRRGEERKVGCMDG